MVENTQFLPDLQRFGAALRHLLAVLEDDTQSDDELLRAWTDCAGYDALLTELSRVDLSAGGAAIVKELSDLRVLHGLVRKTAEREKERLSEALVSLRTFRKQSAFYGADADQSGVSCDMRG